MENHHGKVQLRMAAHVTKVEEPTPLEGEGGGLYIFHLRLSRNDQKGGPTHEMKIGVQADFVDNLDRDQVSDLLRHEIVKRMFEGLDK